jgi:hypothetical protein
MVQGLWLVFGWKRATNGLTRAGFTSHYCKYMFASQSLQLDPTRCLQREAGTGCVYLEDCGEECGKSSCVAEIETYTLEAALTEIMHNQTAICNNLEYASRKVEEGASVRKLQQEEVGFWEVVAKVVCNPLCLLSSASQHL